MSVTIKKQKPRTEWVDEAGNKLDWKRITEKEKVWETITYDIANAALKASAQLRALKQFVSEAVSKAVSAFHKEYTGKKTDFKGNYTITNFDGSIKVMVKTANPIKFDDLTIQKAKDKLSEFLNDGISAKDKTIKTMVLSAFETSRGKLDVDKILSLKKYSDRIDDSRWKEAMKLIDKAIRRPETATYYRVEVKDSNGKFQNIPLDIADM